MSLGSNNYFHIYDTPFDLYLTDFHDLGNAYLKSLTPTTGLLAPYRRDDMLGISQVIALLDFCLNLSLERDMTPPVFNKFTVNGQEFTNLSQDIIILIKQQQQVLVNLNTNDWAPGALQGFHFFFLKEGEKPTLSEKYLERAIIARSKFNL